MMSSYMR